MAAGGLRQAPLAKRLNLAGGSVYGRCHGTCSWRMWELRLVAEACDISLIRLLDMVDLKLEKVLNVTERLGYYGPRAKIRELEAEIRELRKTLSGAGEGG